MSCRSLIAETGTQSHHVSPWPEVYPLPFLLDQSLTPEKLRLQLEIRSAGRIRLARVGINESLGIVSLKQQILSLNLRFNRSQLSISCSSSRISLLSSSPAQPWLAVTPLSQLPQELHSISFPPRFSSPLHRQSGRSVKPLPSSGKLASPLMSTLILNSY